MPVDDLAAFVFLGNKEGHRIDLQVNRGLDTAKDLFCFCLDLLCKGLVLMFGQDGRVDLPDISMEQFAQVQRKMKSMGINCELAIETLDYVPNIFEVIQRMQQANMSPDNLALEEYVYEIVCMSTVYKLKFNLFHNVG